MIQVIHRAVDIIEYIAVDPTRPKLMGHIAEDLNLNTATCANIIKTLVQRGIIEKAQKEKGYILGKNLSEIANGTFGFESLLNNANTAMALAEELLKENNLIAILKKNQRVVIKRKTSNQMVQAVTPEQKNAYDSSTGRLLIAMLPEKELNLYIKRYGLPDKQIWPGADKPQQFAEKIMEIKTQGYVWTEDSVQIVGVAVPIFKNDKVIASFSIYLPSFRLYTGLREKLIKTAIETGKKLSIFN